MFWHFFALNTKFEKFQVCYVRKQIQNVRYDVSRDTHGGCGGRIVHEGEPDVLYLFSDIANLKYFKLSFQSEKNAKT